MQRLIMHGRQSEFSTRKKFEKWRWFTEQGIIVLKNLIKQMQFWGFLAQKVGIFSRKTPKWSKISKIVQLDEAACWMMQVQYFSDHTLGIMISDTHDSPGALDAFLKVVKKLCSMPKWPHHQLSWHFKCRLKWKFWIYWNTYRLFLKCWFGKSMRVWIKISIRNGLTVYFSRVNLILYKITFHIFTLMMNIVRV